ncbi:hypothetical protein [Mycobacterium sp. URHB0044]|jgi:hypothetical protein|uniref:hypothetical protein n=1 Tax=Mycobacterium sp. URHB0044 TaxID=1380386 RepID=UPI000685AB7A|nr:hypothetical protein [Mycobacterium sp. URHB0044]
MGDANWDEVIFVDRDRSAPLWDVGAPGYLAATGIDSDGEEYLALVEVDRLGRDGHSVDVACPSAPHEQLDAVANHIMWRVRVARTFRCGRITQAGTPCRIRIATVGAACEWHRTRAASDRSTP